MAIFNSYVSLPEGSYTYMILYNKNIILTSKKNFCIIFERDFLMDRSGAGCGDIPKKNRPR